MKLLIKMFLVLLFLMGATYALACDAKTTSRSLKIEQQQLTHEILDSKAGQYIGTFKNGDLILASFSQCGLGMHAHYYSRKEIKKTDKQEKLKWFLSLVLPSKAIYEQLQGQVEKIASLEENYLITITDDAESHDFVFKSSVSPLFESVIHYTWNPPPN